MEAEVGLMNRQIMDVVDHNCNSMPAELEVKKLQALVRSLELQNQQLRSRQNRTLSPGPASSKLEHRENNNHNINNKNTPSGVLAYFQAYFSEKQAGDREATTVMDDVEELDLEAMFSSRDSDDETWLYVSSRAAMCADSPPLSPLTWCRKVLDSPRSEGPTRTPSLNLQRVSRWRPSPSPCSLSPSSPLLYRVAVGSSFGASPPLAGKSCSTPLFSRRPASPLASPLLLSPRGSLSPLLKEPLPPAERSPTFLSHLARRGWNSASFDDDERDVVATSYKLNDLTDVQVMARLQEESLRQDYASTAPRRERGPSLSRRTPRPTEEDCGPLTPPQLAPSSLPRPHTFSSARDWHRSSVSLYTPPATPPTSPVQAYASRAFFASPPPRAGPAGPSAAQPQAPRPGSVDKLRRSMPNLVRAPSMPSVHISANQAAPLSLLRNSLSFDSSQTQFHSSIQLQSRVHSVGSFSTPSPTQPPKATAYVSPIIKGSVSVPTGIPSLGNKTPTQPPTLHSSGLPRPASSSAPRISQLPRSLLTPPKTLTQLTPLRHASWNDGCY
ncbi:SLAIN motif-containing protein 1-like isoform X1 [Gadus macrocephalus]|uniref:SLAIN motif-containing protein 1-like isoform X1 n=1 Tax=Gadus macrocephalus TaxID=80720 RepID=UPI0028CB40E6|nr:SLAIN motif-containing protein 1-like isoform X1 [Gadus macrocephalus]